MTNMYILIIQEQGQICEAFQVITAFNKIMPSVPANYG